MVDTIELDYESKSEIDLPEYGLDVYRSHPSTRVLMAAYALNGGAWKHWQAHLDPFPREAREALLDPAVLKWAFNAQFERVMTRDVMKIETPYSGWRCGMVLAGLQGFNGSLDVVGERVGLALDKQKLKTGKHHIDTFCKPQRITSTQPHLWRDWRTDPVQWEEFGEYNVQDGEAERAQRRLLIRYPVPEDEWELYELNEQINDRGLPVDLVFVKHAIEMSARRKRELTDQMREICGLDNPGSIQQLLPWLRDNGYWFDDLNKNTVSKVLAVDKAAGLARLTDECRAILRLRQWQARLSTKKYDAILKRTGEGSRLRFGYVQAGAGRTARFINRGVQTQNLKTTPDSLEEDHVLDEANRIIRANDYDALELFIEEPMEALTGCVRSAFRAEPGKKFVVADLKSIESAMVAIEAECEPLLEEFRQGLDPYKAFGVGLFGVKYEDVTRAQRKFCKPPKLGCAYRLGGGYLRDGKRTGLWGYAENMGVDMEQKEAIRAVKVFRSMYPEIADEWVELEDAIARTLDTKKNTRCGLVEFEYRKPYLLMWLPTGRPVYYFLPLMKMRTVSTGRMIMKVSRGWEEDGAERGALVEVEETFTRRSFTYMGQNQVTRQWVRIDSHGGRTIEQETQANAREVLKYGLLEAGREGYPMCGHSHDEIIAEVDEGSNEYTLAGLGACMTKSIAAYPGLPLGYAGYEGPFYKKD